MKNHCISIITENYDRLMSLSTPEELFSAAVELVKDHRIERLDARKMLLELERNKESLPQLQKYITNAMLKFQGLGTKYTC